MVDFRPTFTLGMWQEEARPSVERMNEPISVIDTIASAAPSIGTFNRCIKVSSMVAGTNEDVSGQAHVRRVRYIDAVVLQQIDCQTGHSFRDEFDRGIAST